MYAPAIQRLYYSTSEVCEIAHIEIHTLRNWEQKFHVLKPVRSKTGRRLYKPVDMDVILMISQLRDKGLTDTQIDSDLKKHGKKKFIEVAKEHLRKKQHYSSLFREMDDILHEILKIIESPS